MTHRLFTNYFAFALQLDFNTLDISVLRRYKRIHRLKVTEPATKEQLVQAVSKHYAAMKPIENEVIATFIYAVHNKGM